MARNVDWDNPTEDDLRWAVEWELWRELQQAGYDPEELRQQLTGDDSGKVEVDVFNTGGVPRGGQDNPSALAKSGKRVSLRDDDNGDGTSADGSDDVEELPDDYRQWNVTQLRAELADRQLPGDGKKDDLVARLEADDEAAEQQ
jgi:hypothetical protein